MLTNIIDDIRALIGRPVDFYIPTYSGCGICNLDIVSNHSQDPFCSGCNGKYWIPAYAVTTVTGHVNWGQVNVLDWYAGGQQFDGDCRIQIKWRGNITRTMLDGTEYIVADGKVLEIQSEIPRGVPAVNRILLDCIEKEKTV